MAKVADALRAVGSEPAIQLTHAGRQTNRTLLDGVQPVAPSPLAAASIYRDPPRAPTIGEIADWSRPTPPRPAAPCQPGTG